MPRPAIDKARVRAKLEPRTGAYWGPPIASGLVLGFRRTTAGSAGAWVARSIAPEDDGRRYVVKSLGGVTPDNTHEAARVAALAWHKQLHAGVSSSEVSTVADACREYVGRQLSEKGQDAALDADRRFKRYVYADPIGRALLSKISQRQIEQWRDRLSEADPDTGDLAPATLNRNLTTLKAALNYAVERRYIGAERAIEWRLVKPLKADNRRELFLDREQRRALLAAAHGDVRDLIEAVTLTGSRGGEVANALVRQFDARTGSMTFDGKTGKRTVPLSPQAVELFKRAAQGKKPGDLLFTRAGGQWYAYDWAGPVREAAQAAKLPEGACLYTLRHSFITEAITSGMSLLEVARLVGTSLAMIDKHYGHLVQDGARSRLAALQMA